MSLENKIEEQKTEQKLEAMGDKAYSLYNEDKEKMYREKQGKIFEPGKCLPEEIQKVKTKDKLCIVGFAPSWNETPWDDETFDIWGINELYLQVIKEYGRMRRFTTWFEIHNPFSPTRNIPAHHEWMKKWDKPILMQQHYDWIPNSIPIPKDLIIDFFNQNFVIDKVGGSFSDYSNQISVMTAMAIVLGYKEIHIYGVDMAQWSEYAWQRSSCQFFIGYAAGCGMRVLVPLTSELCKYPGFYGFETDNRARMLLKKRSKTMKGSIKDIDQQMIINEFEREEQHQAYSQAMLQIDNGLQRIDDEMIKLDITLHKNNEIIMQFFKSMPKDLKTIMAKKDELIKNIEKQNQDIARDIKVFEDNKKKLLAQKRDRKRVEYIQKKTFERAQKNYEFAIQGYQGINADISHLLQNNIV